MLGDLDSLKVAHLSNEEALVPSKEPTKMGFVKIWEMLWLKALLKDVGVHSKHPIKLYCDNKASISIAHNPI